MGIWKSPFKDWLIKFNPFISISVIFLLATSNSGFRFSVWFWAAVLYAIISASISFMSFPYHKTMDSLEKKLKESNTKLDEVAGNIPYLFDGILINLWNRLGFKPEHQARISIYVHHDAAKHFTPCGRYSSNPEFKRQRRTQYPDGQGYIWEGWQNGWHYNDNFPTSYKSYLRYNEKKYNVPRETSKNIRMRPSFCAIKCLKDRDHNPHAVMVVEGEKKLCHITPKELEARLESLAPDYAHMIRVLRGYIPSSEDAEEEQL